MNDSLENSSKKTRLSKINSVRIILKKEKPVELVE
jgi:hypothetical protein